MDSFDSFERAAAISEKDLLCPLRVIALDSKLYFVILLIAIFYLLIRIRFESNLLQLHSMSQHGRDPEILLTVRT